MGLAEDRLARAQREQRAAEKRRLSADRDRAGRNVWWRRGGRIVRRQMGKLVLRVSAPLILRGLASTWRIERLDGARFDAACQLPGFIACCWHGRMLPAIALHAHRGLTVLVSPSDDGDLVVPLLQRRGYRVIRGSTNRQGARALHEMLTQLQTGGGLVLTPDGPRGPRHSMNTGPAFLGRERRMPILCTGFACDRAWRLRSWDRFTIPKPYARVVVAYEPLLTVAPTGGDDELERVTEAIRAGILAAEQRAFAHLGRPTDWQL